MRPTCGPDGRGSTRPRSHPHRSRADASPQPRTPVSFRALPPTGRANSSSIALVHSAAAGLRRSARGADSDADAGTRRAAVRCARGAARRRRAGLIALSETDPIGWVAQIPRSREYLRALDDAIARRARRRAGSRRSGSFPPTSCARCDATRRTRSIRTRSRVDPLRAPNVGAGDEARRAARDQIRTMIALHDCAGRAGARRAAVREGPDWSGNCRPPARAARWTAGRGALGRRGAQRSGGDALAARCSRASPLISAT